MSKKAPDPEKQSLPTAQPVQSSNFKRRIVSFICLSTALYGLYSLTHIWSRVATVHRDVLHVKPPPLDVHEREKLFLSVPNGKSAHAAAKTFASHPHVAGSPQDYEDAQKMLSFFQTELGIKPPRKPPIFPAGTPKSRAATIGLTELLRPHGPTAWIDVYYPILDAPLGRSLELLDTKGNSMWSADLNEDGDPLDEDAHAYRDFVPAWHGFSSHGEAEGQIIYANYGTKEDYDELVEAGTNLTGKIVLVRYGDTARGLKVKGAEELGAAGVLIYSDIRDDGYVTVENGYEPYPRGPARNPTSIQRGSVLYFTKHPGDPTTPGYPAYERAERQEPVNLVKIPSLPISWHNAQRILEEVGEIYTQDSDIRKKKLSGKSSISKVRMVNHVDYNITPIWNTMAAIPGHIKDEVVIVGNHRDAWVLGAGDPISGTASLHEIVRGFGELLRQGWKPLRTILIASWDAEEHGLIGSTEYGEDFADWLSEHAITYVNVDVSSAGSRWTALGSPSLAHLIKRTALDIPHPTEEGKTLWDARDDKGPFSGLNGTRSTSAWADPEYIQDYEKKVEEEASLSTGVGPLGSGSDFTVFLQRLGIASMDQNFAPTPYDAVWHDHSIYDTVRWQEEYADPGYNKHVAVARHLGLTVMRLTDTVIIPLNTTQYAFELDDYLDKVEDLAADIFGDREDDDITPHLSLLRDQIERLQDASLELDEEKVAAEENFRKALDRLPSFPRPASSRSHSHRCGGVTGRLSAWYHSIFGPNESETVYDHIDDWKDFLSLPLEDGDSFARLSRLPFPKNPWLDFLRAARRLVKVNKKVFGFERGFLHPDGISKDREWYRHLGVAPGKWLGYGATTFPALTEAIAIDKNADAAKEEVLRLIEVLVGLTAQTRP